MRCGPNDITCTRTHTHTHVHTRAHSHPREQEQVCPVGLSEVCRVHSWLWLTLPPSDVMWPQRKHPYRHFRSIWLKPGSKRIPVSGLGTLEQNQGGPCLNWELQWMSFQLCLCRVLVPLPWHHCKELSRRLTVKYWQQGCQLAAAEQISPDKMYFNFLWYPLDLCRIQVDDPHAQRSLALTHRAASRNTVVFCICAACLPWILHHSQNATLFMVYYSILWKNGKPQINIDQNRLFPTDTIWLLSNSDWLQWCCVHVFLHTHLCVHLTCSMAVRWVWLWRRKTMKRQICERE